MNFIKLNNNIDPSRMLIKSGYQFEKMKLETPAPMAPFGNYGIRNVPYKYNLEDEYSIVERNYEEEDDRDDKKGKILSSAKVVIEKLPDDLVQKYLSKKPKNYEQMNFGKKISNSSGHYIVKRETIRMTKQYSAKKQNIQTSEFLKGLCNQNMQKYLANTEMADLATQMHEPQGCFARIDHYPNDNSLENAFCPNEMQYSVKMERNYQTSDYLQQQPVKVENGYVADSFVKSQTYPTVQQHAGRAYLIEKQQNVDVIRKGDIVKNPLFFMKQHTNKKQKRTSNRKQNRKSFASKLCQRICPNCKKYVPHANNTTLKLQCENCKSFTWYECKKCQKQVPSYNAISHHLHYLCAARDLYKCAHCKYTVKRKVALALHMKRKHFKRFQKKGKNTEKAGNKPYQDLENDKQYENLIVLKKCSQGSPSSTKQISALLDSNSTSVRKMSELYCTHCECEVHFDSSHNSKSDFYCRRCSTDLIFKCLKCSSACTTYDDMKHHLKKGCTVEEPKKVENTRECFYCPDCNYRSYFEGLVNNHYNKIHNFDTQKFSPDNSAQSSNENDFDFYYSEQEGTGEL